MLSTVLSGIRLVKSFAQEHRESQRFLKYSSYQRESRTAVDKQAGTFFPFMSFTFSLGGLIVWYLGGRDVIGGELTLGTLMAFLGYLALFYAPLSSLTMLSNWLTSFMTASQRIFEILDSQPQIIEVKNPKAVTTLRGEITFDKVIFGYDPYNPVLKNVSFKINPGEMIGIVGKSGSGKTTIINLVCRFYDPNHGMVMLDDIDVREMKKEDVHRNVGLVLQEPFLFRGSIASNIAYGRPDATLEEIMEAAKAANAHEFIIKMPQGYDTRVGERGAGLSGGERQRISIARALLCDPTILILDEATSSVDTESEKRIQDALKVLTKGRTTIAIAHRLSTLRDAHRIFVVDAGRIVEEGTHEALLERQGIYYRLVKIQTQLTNEPSVSRLVTEMKGN
jgi:ATP-binding cassette subfamily B protein